MADETYAGAERTEEPSQRRLQQARERGQVPRSRELGMFAVMLGGSAALLAVGRSLTAHLMQVMRRGLVLDAQSLRDPHSMSEHLTDAGISALTALLPLFAALLAAVLLAAVILGGWNFRIRALAPDFARLSASSGWQRMFGLQGAAELGKALLKFVAVGAVCAAIVWWLFRDVMALGRMSPRAGIGRGVELLSWAFIWLSASLALIAAIDVPLQLQQFKRSLRMTRQQVRDESKEFDGRPETKQRIRQVQQTLARGRTLHLVPAADVVIVDPAHFAVALKYEPAKMRAPRILAKGAVRAAAHIGRLAQEHRVPVVESPALARALYRSGELNADISEDLYAEVAQVFSGIDRYRGT